MLSRDELVSQLGGLSSASGEFGNHAPSGHNGFIVMETTDKIGGALGGVQRLTTVGGVLEGRVARSLITGGDSPTSSAAGESLGDSESEVG